MADNCLGLPLVNRKSKSYLFFVASVLEFRALKIKDFPPPCCPETVIPKLAATKTNDTKQFHELPVFWTNLRNTSNKRHQNKGRIHNYRSDERWVDIIYQYRIDSILHLDLDYS